ncbi:MAG: DUF465 domain-containing protein [Acidiferrobacteraceae bacterium]|jgi:uncharacterized protein YdcH (DUF465 family)
MTLEHHPLVREFPEYQDRIHELKVSDPEFRELFDEYHDVDQEIYRHEQDIEPTSDEYLEPLKMRRVHLKDKLYEMIRRPANT